MATSYVFGLQVSRRFPQGYKVSCGPNGRGLTAPKTRVLGLYNGVVIKW